MKRKLIAAFLGLAGTAFAQTPSSSQNYVVETTVRTPNKTTVGSLSGLPVWQANRTIQYLDGLGRPLQTVQWQASPLGKDIVQVFTYDALGRETKKYQPYAEQYSNDASYKTSGLSNQGSFYGSGTGWDANIPKTAYPFSQTVLEPSPLNRALEQGAPGATWQPYNGAIANSGHTVKTTYGTNAAGEVLLWVASTSSATASTTYPAHKLYKTIAKDKNWSSGKSGTVEEFKDLEGRVILKKIWESESIALNTYYVYDLAGNLRYVIPPAVTVSSFTESDVVFTNYIYGYSYDDRKRNIRKHIPGKGWEEFVYNKLDQLVLSQDANQKPANQWSFMKYDILGREIIRGVVTSSHTRSSWQTSINAQLGVLWETPDPTNTTTSGIGYTSNVLPSITLAGCNIINHYDSYNFYGNNATYDPITTITLQVKGLVTAKKVRVLGGNMLVTVMYYDSDGRLIETIGNNHMTSGTDRSVNSYNFTGAVTKSTRTHKVGAATTTIVNAFTYDHVGRKINSNEKINAQDTVWLSQMVYNEIGQLKEKKLHSSNGSSFMQTTKFAYNERGWLKNSSSPQFSVKLGYDTLANPHYNGNIRTQLWGAGSSYPNMFNYAYDKLNRLTSAASTGIVMSEALTYDVMGNISSMNRDGISGTYSYTGNKLNSIAGGLATGSYVYDVNGNATTDGRSGVTLTYNLLNLPATATKSGLNLAYTYNAVGQKLKKVSTTTGTTTTDYVDGIQYTNGTIEFIQNEVGRALNGSGTYTYQYNLTDHLGNVRYSFDIYSGAIRRLQEDNYYAFGLRKSAGIPVVLDNKYLYNGKELQDGLEQYDYGARFYDPVIGRWNVVDPLAESYNSFSPFNYVENNPISNIDPDGRSTQGFYTRYIDSKGKTLLNTNDGRDDVYVVPDNRLDEFNENVRASSGRLQEGRTDSKGWNNVWRSEFQQVMSESEVNRAGINSLSDEKVKAAAFEYIFGSRSYASFVWEEVKAQWRNPGTVAMGLTAFAHGMVGVISKLQTIGAPKHWDVKPSKKGGGILYQDPLSPHNSIREMPGNPNSPNPAQRQPYVIFKKSGVAYDATGNALKSASDPAAHIPLSQFDIKKMPKF